MYASSIASDQTLALPPAYGENNNLMYDMDHLFWHDSLTMTREFEASKAYVG